MSNDPGAMSYSKVRAGDSEGLREIIEAYRIPLTFYLNSLLLDAVLAEDVAEEVFVDLWFRKPHFQGKSTFKTWLFKIGRNRALDRLRRNQRNHAESFSEDQISITSEVWNPEQLYLAGERRKEVWNCILRLHAEYKQVLWLTYYEQLSIKEVSEIMKKSPHAAETLLYRAKNALRKELVKEGITDEIK